MLPWLLGLPLGWFAADFLAGAFHLLADRSPAHWPVVRRFHAHHLAGWNDELPAAWKAIVGGLVVAAIAAVLAPSAWAPFAMTLALGVGLAHQGHHWAHDRGGRLVRLLQRLRVLMPPGAHVRHHRDTRGDYCALNGWAEPAVALFYRRGG
jgi:hypothetical protein